MKSKSELLADILNAEETAERRHRELVEAITSVADEICAFNRYMQETLMYWNPNPEPVTVTTCNHKCPKPRAVKKTK